MDVIYILGFLWAFWYFYVLIMGLYRAQLSNRLGPVTKVLGYPAVLVGLIMDVVCNLTVAVIIFRDMPDEWLVTSRLKRYVAGEDGWRKKWAVWICDNLLDPFDPHGDHC